MVGSPLPNILIFVSYKYKTTDIITIELLWSVSLTLCSSLANDTIFQEVMKIGNEKIKEIKNDDDILLNNQISRFSFQLISAQYTKMTAYVTYSDSIGMNIMGKATNGKLELTFGSE